MGGGGQSGGSVGGGVQVGQFGVVGGGEWHKALVVSSGGGGAPRTSPCRPSNHTITINLTLTFAATWFGHASHFDWAEHHPPNFIHAYAFATSLLSILDPNTHSNPSLG